MPDVPLVLLVVQNQDTTDSWVRCGFALKASVAQEEKNLDPGVT